MTGRGLSRLSNARGVGTVGIIVLLIIALIAAGAIGALLGYFTSKIGIGFSIREIFVPPFGGKKIVRVLVLGEDNTGIRKPGSRGLSDTIILLSVNLDTGYVAAISIPRDTMVDLDGYGGRCKVNAAHVFGGPTLTMLAASQLTGVSPDYYVKTNIEGFKGIVDTVGGVEIYVEKNMRYRDRRGGLYINLKKGRQMLDGEKAMQYVRFRHDVMGDIARIERQQKFLRALVKRALSPANLPKLPQVVNAALENVQTDMNPKDVLYLGRFAARMDFSQVRMATLPGVPRTIGGASYWMADGRKTTEVVRELFFPETGTALLKVEVLNGSGIKGAATQVAELLKQHGYEVTKVGNAETSSHAASEVIDHNADSRGVDRIAALVNSRVVRRECDGSAPADVTVIVGRDYASARP